MIEAILAWGMLLAGSVTGDSGCFIASAGFAIAAQVSRIVDVWKEGKHGCTK